MHKNIILFIFVLSLIGCKQGNQAKLPLANTLLSVKQTESIKDCDLFEDSVTMISLDISKSNISIPSKIMIYGKKIFVLDKIIRKQLCAFSESGEYICNIGERGWGRNEYSQPYDFDIRNDSVFVIDSNKRKVLVYNLEGKFLLDYEQPKMVDGILALKDGNFLLSVSEMEKDSEYRLFLMDEKMREKNGILLMDKDRTDDKVADNVFQRVGEFIYYHRSFDSEIVELNQYGKCLRIIDVRFKRERVPETYHTMGYGKLKEALSQHCYEFFIDCPIIVDGNLFANCFIGNKKATIAIDGHTEIEYDNIYDPQNSVQHYRDLFFPKTYFDNQIVGVFDASMLPLFEEECVLPTYIKNKLENGDLVLCFYRLRHSEDPIMMAHSI